MAYLYLLLSLWPFEGSLFDVFDSFVESDCDCFGSEPIEVSSCEIRGKIINDQPKVNVLGKLKFVSLSLENLDPVIFVGTNPQVDLLVESARSHDTRIKQIGPVCCSDNKYPSHLGGHVHLGQKLGDDAVHDLAGVRCAASLRHQRVKLVEEDDARPIFGCLLESLPDIFLALPDVHVQHFWTLHADKIHLAFIGYALRQKRLPRAWGSVKQQTCARLDQVIE